MAGAFHIVNGSFKPCAAQRISFAPTPVPNFIRRPSSVSCFVERRAPQKTARCDSHRHHAAPITAVAATEERTQQYVDTSISEIFYASISADGHILHAGSRRQ